MLLYSLTAAGMAADSNGTDMRRLGGLAIDTTEVTVEQFARYAQSTGAVT